MMALQQEHFPEKWRPVFRKEMRQQLNLKPQMDLPSRASMLAALVSPAERPVSCLPLKVISVLCTRTLNLRSRSFWVSKSISNLATSLNFGWAERLARMGAWALQVGHQGAVTSTRIELPAACAASNAAASNGFLSRAVAGAADRSIGDAASAAR